MTPALVIALLTLSTAVSPSWVGRALVGPSLPIEVNHHRDAHDLLARILAAEDVALPSQWVALRTIEPALSEVRSQTANVSDARHRAGLVLQVLHQRLLRGEYQPSASCISGTFKNGNYNCLSATLLYNALARAANLQTAAVAWPTHVCSLVLVDDERMEVEPTCRNWFELKSDDERAAARCRAFAVANAESPVAGRELNDSQLLALVCFNRGVERLAEGRFAEAVASNREALQLDAKSAQAQANLLASLNNWATDCARQGDPEQARRLLQECRSLAPGEAWIVENLARLQMAR